ncbi:FAD-binding oxidoreductase [Streptomyces verrucosisporus]|uniref:FAD-binding oxidoreductase n=1 Tax=Streptomyces verrucosisporus TaxID=1695161 RepID=UPI0019D2CCAB|nr:FAD-binding oxidoreductase [Streptomyces verrucosisporus]MBN3928622.1 FAD-binding oxidoreductase [Streptomyces verrucosisporus]
MERTPHSDTGTGTGTGGIFDADDLPATTGPVLRPGDPGYDEEVSGFQTAWTHRPDLVVGAADAEDVRLAVAYAAGRRLPVAVQATGHGLSVAAGGGVLIGTRRMAGVSVGPERRTARVAAGARWGTVVAAAAAHGLAPLNGSSPTVGAVGYTLGGGIGLLARRFGYAADHVRALEVVTADGRPRRTVPGDELFGALLGTGGNFGVVTAMEIDLFPVPALYGGQLVFGAPPMERALEVWRRWTADVPETLTSSVALLSYPDLPTVPAPLRGRYAASFRIVHSGPAGEGERLVAPLRAVGERLVDDLREMPYAECDSIHRDPPFPQPYTATNALLRELPPEALSAVLDTVGPGSPVPCVTDVRHLGGALGRRGPAGVAVDHREARYIVRAIAFPGPPPGGTGHSLRQVRERFDLLREALAPWTPGHSPAFLHGDGERAGEAQTRAGYDPGTYERLAALKAAHDPHNLFRFNRNIRPADADRSAAAAP